MSDIAIRVESLSKRYEIGVARHDTLRDHITHGLATLFRRNDRSSSANPENTIWALKNVSFDVRHGEVVGFIGRNGAGKSTLLKILSRITEPTTGLAEIHGRVGSLLEVGTGFHGELSGRENIYLNAAILGMKRAEIDRKFDEIVDFSGVEKFIDTPVKHYSSGMYVRLAFAVAAHLEPEILIVDEVLAVGDIAFQKKCLGKMTEVSQEGRTVLFVSHNLGAVEHLCTKGLVLEQGNVVCSGSSKEAVAHYVHNSFEKGPNESSYIFDLSKAANRSPRYRPLLKRLELYAGDGKPINGGLQLGAPLEAHIYFRLERPTFRFDAALGFDNLLGQRIFSAHSIFEPDLRQEERVGEQIFVCKIPSLTLVPGEYRMKVSLNINNSPADVVEDTARLTIIESDYYRTGYMDSKGLVVLEQHWHLK